MDFKAKVDLSSSALFCPLRKAIPTVICDREWNRESLSENDSTVPNQMKPFKSAYCFVSQKGQGMFKVERNEYDLWPNFML